MGWYDHGLGLLCTVVALGGLHIDWPWAFHALDWLLSVLFMVSPWAPFDLICLPWAGLG
jgi:hypothetical protein